MTRYEASLILDTVPDCEPYDDVHQAKFEVVADFYAWPKKWNNRSTTSTVSKE